MSVAKHPAYFDTAFQRFCRLVGICEENADFLNKLLDFDIDDPGEHKVPLDLKKGNIMR